MTGKNNKTGMAVQIGKLEASMDFIKDDIEKLNEGQERIIKKLAEISNQVAINKTKLGIFSTIAGFGGGAIVMIIKILIK